jgi:hypothetical protein
MQFEAGKVKKPHNIVKPFGIFNLLLTFLRECLEDSTTINRRN